MLEYPPAPQPEQPRTLIVIDNHDSFTFNLVQALASLGARCLVIGNDELDLAALLSFSCDGCVISPGPGRPEQAGITLEVIRAAPARLPLLGVCLGYQAIAQAFGGRVVRAERAVHGKLCSIEHEQRGLFAGLPSPVEMARYNSLSVERASLPSCLLPLATSEGEIMALAHRERPIHGVQFHPESALSALGSLLLSNWLKSLP
jgi:anthranilate synthase/aminodeoxychorismate synthase-like glutamine amidotransferase